MAPRPGPPSTWQRSSPPGVLRCHLWVPGGGQRTEGHIGTWAAMDRGPGEGAWQTWERSWAGASLGGRCHLDKCHQDGGQADRKRLGVGGRRERGAWGAERETGLGAASLPPALPPPLLAFPEPGWAGGATSSWAARPQETGGRCCVHTGALGAVCSWAKLFPSEPAPRVEWAQDPLPGISRAGLPPLQKTARAEREGAALLDTGAEGQARASLASAQRRPRTPGPSASSLGLREAPPAVSPSAPPPEGALPQRAQQGQRVVAACPCTAPQRGLAAAHLAAYPALPSSPVSSPPPLPRFGAAGIGQQKSVVLLGPLPAEPAPAPRPALPGAPPRPAASASAAMARRRQQLLHRCHGGAGG